MCAGPSYEKNKIMDEGRRVGRQRETFWGEKKRDLEMKSAVMIH